MAALIHRGLNFQKVREKRRDSAIRMVSTGRNVVPKYQFAGTAEYHSNVTFLLQRATTCATILFLRAIISKVEGQHRMSDTFGFSTPGNNHGGNLSDSKSDSHATRSTQNSQTNSSKDAALQSGDAANSQPRAERRKRRRALISAPVRVRSVDVTESGPDEISTTLDVSRNGILFASKHSSFVTGMEVAVTFPYTNVAGVQQAEQAGRVLRVRPLEDGHLGIAIGLGMGVGEDLVDAAGRNLFAKPEPAQAPASTTAAASLKRPLVLAVDADVAIRESLKSYLTAEGYQVIAVSSSREAHEVLKLRTPDLLIAEIEGEDLPGYELCAHVKSTPRLQTIPVVLLTLSAYPSDYSNAHSLGAVVCMAKPYRQERLGHVVRLLAPTPEAKQQTAPARPADKTRRAGVTNKRTSSNINSVEPRGDSSWW
jgi:CheY-like chemotaxis protein